MKIEKINDNQIRCTLTKEDLASRELKISELAYGTEKAKNLFRDMMRQANFEFGFEAEDIPLMIEAVPLNGDCIVLIVTKVEDPEELDTRFSRFAPSVMEDNENPEWDNENPNSEMLDLFRKIQEVRKPSPADSKQTSVEQDGSEDDTKRTRVFVLNSLQQVMNAAKVTVAHYNGFSSLYKDEKEGLYLLVLTQGEASHEVFDRICNIISEYGSPRRMQSASLSFLREHYEALIAENALQALGDL
uniref:adaptor protein MecA n=1 Tax=Acetatifactor sp. TaxID=1872090 RepID=UPI0040578C33